MKTLLLAVLPLLMGAAPTYTTADLTLYLGFPDAGGSDNNSCQNPARPCLTCAGMRSKTPNFNYHHLNWVVNTGAYGVPEGAIDGGMLFSGCDLTGVTTVTTGPYADGAYFAINGTLVNDFAEADGGSLTAFGGSTVNDGSFINQVLNVNPDGGSGVLFTIDGGASTVRSLVEEELVITGGTGAGPAGVIVSNTVSSITFIGFTAPDNTSTFVVQKLGSSFVDYKLSDPSTGVVSWLMTDLSSGDQHTSVNNIILNAATPQTNATLLTDNSSLSMTNVAFKSVGGGWCGTIYGGSPNFNNVSCDYGQAGFFVSQGSNMFATGLFAATYGNGFSGAFSASGGATVTPFAFDVEGGRYCAIASQGGVISPSNGVCNTTRGGFVAQTGGIVPFVTSIQGAIPYFSTTEGCFEAKNGGNITFADNSSNCFQGVLPDAGLGPTSDGGFYAVITLGSTATQTVSKAALEAAANKTISDATQLDSIHE